MAEDKVNPANGSFGLKGSRDTDITDLDADQYDVFTTDKNLAEARAAFPDYDWFAYFSVKDKQGNFANVNYTVTFNKPASGNLVYYLNGSIHPLQYSDTNPKDGQARVKATLNVGDPPIGLR